MIDIPLGKALVPVESNINQNDAEYCTECFFKKPDYHCCKEWIFRCSGKFRKDGKNVIFKLVDYLAKEKK
jgi:hypothetical protein